MLFLLKYPSVENPRPSTPTSIVVSLFWLLPLRKRKSKTPAIPLPYSAGKAEVKKSVLANTLALNILTEPPVNRVKWFGFGTSTPSNLHNKVLGELPLITISLFKSSPPPVTPAKFWTCLAGSPKDAAYRLACSGFKVRALTVTNSLTVISLRFSATITTSSSCAKFSTKLISKTTSFPAVTLILGNVKVS